MVDVDSVESLLCHMVRVAHTILLVRIYILGKVSGCISKMWEPIYVFIMEYKCSKFYILLIRS